MELFLYKRVTDLYNNTIIAKIPKGCIRQASTKLPFNAKIIDLPSPQPGQ
jgi:hypothetical protein